MMKRALILHLCNQVLSIKLVAICLFLNDTNAIVTGSMIGSMNNDSQVSRPTNNISEVWSAQAG